MTALNAECAGSRGSGAPQILLGGEARLFEKAGLLGRGIRRSIVVQSLTGQRHVQFFAYA